MQNKYQDTVNDILLIQNFTDTFGYSSTINENATYPIYSMAHISFNDFEPPGWDRSTNTSIEGMSWYYSKDVFEENEAPFVEQNNKFQVLHSILVPVTYLTQKGLILVYFGWDNNGEFV